MSNSDFLTKFDEWLQNDSAIAALVMRQWLEPVEGKDAVIFPPTYAKPERTKEEDWLGYNIDRFEDGSSVCQIDSVGAQANRMEPIFGREPYSKLVPQIVIRTDAGAQEVSLLDDAGHRAADAIVRFSTLGPKMHEAFLAYRTEGNAEPLAKIAPTSIVFGSWDSRATQAKLPRLVRSVIRAYNVKTLHRSAQYSTVAGEILEGGGAEVTTRGPKAELGLAHVPAAWVHGGVQVLGEIRRDAILNLTAVRAVAGANGSDVLTIRRYLFGLALVSFTAPLNTFLREGCELVFDTNRAAEWELVNYNGERDNLTVTHDQAIVFAKAAAAKFGVSEIEPGVFDSGLANAVMTLSEQDRKKLLKQGAVTKEAIEKLKKKPKGKGKNKGLGEETKD